MVKNLHLVFMQFMFSETKYCLSINTMYKYEVRGKSSGIVLLLFRLVKLKFDFKKSWFFNILTFFGGLEKMISYKLLNSM